MNIEIIIYRNWIDLVWSIINILKIIKSHTIQLEVELYFFDEMKGVIYSLLLNKRK